MWCVCVHVHTHTRGFVLTCGSTLEAIVSFQATVQHFLHYINNTDGAKVQNPAKCK